MIEAGALFLTAVLISVLALSSGIAGSNFWTPIFILYLRLPVQEAFWASQVVMLAGFGSGVSRNVMDRTIDWPVVGRVARWAVPGAAVGAAVAYAVPEVCLLYGLAVFVMLLGVMMLSGAEVRTRYPPVSAPIAFVAGLLKGLIATGTGAVLLPALLNDRRTTSSARAVGTNVVVVFFCTVVSVLFRSDLAAMAVKEEKLLELWRMLVIVIPGVIIGGQLGPRLAQCLSAQSMRRYVGALLLVVALIMAFKASQQVGA